MSNYHPRRFDIQPSSGPDAASLRYHIYGKTPIIFVDTYDHEKFDSDLKAVLQDDSIPECPKEDHVFEWIPGLGTLSWSSKEILDEGDGDIDESANESQGDDLASSLRRFLFDRYYPAEGNSPLVLILRGGTSFFGKDRFPESVSWLRMIAGNDMQDETLSPLGDVECTSAFRFVIIVGPNPSIPPELVPYSAKITTKRPQIARKSDSQNISRRRRRNRNSIEEIMKAELQRLRRNSKDMETECWYGQEEQVERFIQKNAPSLIGFTESEIQLLLRAAIEDGDSQEMTEDMLRKAKAKMVERTGFLKLIAESSPQDGGNADGVSGGESNSESSGEDTFAGLERIKDHLKRARILSELRVSERSVLQGFGTKGILLVGMPGCGKSLAAKAAGKILGWPVINLDVGRLLGKYVGESEANLRLALDIAERASPCVLWIDELEKAFSGLDSSDGTALRLFGHFLTWLNEKTSQVYVIATANNIDKIPDEFKRKGRFDEIFRILLPNESERRDIFMFHIRRFTRQGPLRQHLAKWQSESELETACGELAKESAWSKKDGRGFSGADIAAVVNGAAMAALCRYGVFEQGVISCQTFLSAMKGIIAQMKHDGTTQRAIMEADKVFDDSGKEIDNGYSRMEHRLKAGGFKPASTNED